MVSRRFAAVCPLLEVVQSQLTLGRACSTFNIPGKDQLLIIICADATPLWHTSATKCDIHVTVWSEGVAAASDVRRLATWWACDGPDDTNCRLGALPRWVSLSPFPGRWCPLPFPLPRASFCRPPLPWRRSPSRPRPCPYPFPCPFPRFSPSVTFLPLPLLVPWCCSPFAAPSVPFPFPAGSRSLRPPPLPPPPPPPPALLGPAAAGRLAAAFGAA